MFYRRKILLALLQLFDGQLEKIRLQKFLFLFANRKTEPEYHFVPYKFGCYSYTAKADLKAMVSQGLLAEYENYIQKKDICDYLKQIKPSDLALLQEIKSVYGKMNTNALMKYTYINFPFYAIKSEKAPNILTKEEYEKVINAIPNINKIVLYTIGYEGISLEEYFVRLLKNDVKVLVDVRYNPLSMKYGFSKSQLKKYCNSLDIEYVHFPEVGIQGDMRHNLVTQSDYDNLFAIYRENNLTRTIAQQKAILKLLKYNKRIALTCFESNIHQCHRKYLSEALHKLSDFDFEIKHI